MILSIFVDGLGVLQTRQSSAPQGDLDPSCVEALGDLLRSASPHGDVRLCFTSTWRLRSDAFRRVRWGLHPVLSALDIDLEPLPVLESSFIAQIRKGEPVPTLLGPLTFDPRQAGEGLRPFEIVTQLGPGKRRFVILDDEPMPEVLWPWTVAVDPWEGLAGAQVEAAMQVLLG